MSTSRTTRSPPIALVDHAYAALLLDLGLPGGSGLEVLRAMRARYDATPALIITARDQLGDRIRGLDAGADDYIVKPFQIDELLARLRAVLRRSQRRRSRPVLHYGDISRGSGAARSHARRPARSAEHARVPHAAGVDGAPGHGGCARAIWKI